MTVATLVTATGNENRKAVVAGTIGNVLEWYDFRVFGYLATTMSQLFFPGVAQNEGDSIYSSRMLVTLNTATSPVTGTFTFVVNVT